MEEENKMKSELDLLLDALQKEVDYLRYAQEQCILLGDYIGADYFQKSIGIATEKLRVVKLLKNPVAEKINRIEFRIKFRKEQEKPKLKNPYKKEKEDSYHNKQMEEWLEKGSETFKQKQLKNDELELEKLKSTPPPESRPDDDQLISLFEQLANREISKIEFLLSRTSKKKFNLQIVRIGPMVTISLIPTEDVEIKRYISRDKFPLLRQLGFDPTTFKKVIPNFRTQDITSHLQCLSVFFFEVLHIFGNEAIEVLVE